MSDYVLEKRIKISPSQISMLLECPKCLWLYFNKAIKRPSGIFPSLPGGMDRLFKVYFDKYRKKGVLPPEIKGSIKAKLYDLDPDKFNDWRINQRGIKAEFPEYNMLVKGAIDELLVDGKGQLVILDYKTRGAPIKEDTAEKYQGQLDLYALLFDMNGYKVSDQGYLLFFYPKSYSQGKATFETELVKMNIGSKGGINLLKQVDKILKGRMPKAHEECKYCKYVESF